jgi:uncharacterized Fe-S cluster-containing MiaB family protein
MTEKERRAQDGPECPVCCYSDWAYDSHTGQWCVSCGYVKHATGSKWKTESVIKHNKEVRRKHERG